MIGLLMGNNDALNGHKFQRLDASRAADVALRGQGPLVLLFALSSISTRREMRPLQERLCAHYQTVAAEFSKPHGTSRGFSSRNAPQLYLFQCGLELFE
jgi:hypothetical protein